MLLVSGEVRRVLPDQYESNGKMVEQAIVILEPQYGRQNIEVHLTPKQVKAGVKDEWEKLKGQKAAALVYLYINHDYKFHKYNAVGDGKPFVQPELEVIS